MTYQTNPQTRTGGVVISPRMILTILIVTVAILCLVFGVLVMLQSALTLTWVTDLTRGINLPRWQIDLTKIEISAPDRKLLYLFLALELFAVVSGIADMKRFGFLSSAGILLFHFGFLLPDPALRIAAIWSSGLLQIKFRQSGKTAFVQVGLALVAASLFVVGLFGPAIGIRDAILAVRSLEGPLILLGYIWVYIIQMFCWVGEGIDGMPAAVQRIGMVFLTIILGGNPWLGLQGNFISVLQADKIIAGGFGTALWLALDTHLGLLLAGGLVADDLIETAWFKFWNLVVLVILAGGSWTLGEKFNVQPILFFSVAMVAFAGAVTYAGIGGTMGEMAEGMETVRDEWWGDIRIWGPLRVPVNAIAGIMTLVMSAGVFDRNALILMFLNGLMGR